MLGANAVPQPTLAVIGTTINPKPTIHTVIDKLVDPIIMSESIVFKTFPIFFYFSFELLKNFSLTF